ncbi:DinB family protein [Streptomyces sp. CRN 30]|uniref:DinB family protein n=1 Tax=Streptomyces sp. CRN 30 TaxID=3075613 RepID=UPI002A828CC2|nr:DinB family protein [Streptomyces sp. CRN 30]
MTTTTTPDGRPVPPTHAAERPLLEAWLDFHRATLVHKCAGLDDGRLRTASAPPSPMTLLGLVQHLAEVERHWFQGVFAGLDVPPVFGEDNPDGFLLLPGRGLDEATAVWRDEIDKGRALIAGASLDDPLGGGRTPLRWILVHLIEEYARHNGHADLIRERLDGVTGV